MEHRRLRAYARRSTQPNLWSQRTRVESKSQKSWLIDLVKFISEFIQLEILDNFLQLKLRE